GHQPPYGIAVEKLHRQPLQVGEDLLADAVDDALAGVVQDIDLTVPEEKRADDDGHMNPGDPGDGVEVRRAQKPDLVRTEAHRGTRCFLGCDGMPIVSGQRLAGPGAGSVPGGKAARGSSKDKRCSSMAMRTR